MKLKIKLGKKYEIYWLDTFSYNGWYDEKGLREKAKGAKDLIKTIGYFAGEMYGYYCFVSQMISNSDNFDNLGHPNWIPKGCIKKIKILK